MTLTILLFLAGTVLTALLPMGILYATRQHPMLRLSMGGLVYGAILAAGGFFMGRQDQLSPSLLLGAFIAALVMGSWMGRLNYTWWMTPFLKLQSALIDLSLGKIQIRLDLPAGPVWQTYNQSFNHFIERMTGTMKYFEEVGQGDLTLEPPLWSEQDQFGAALISMIHGLRQGLGEVLSRIDQMSKQSGMIALSIRQAGEATDQVTATISQVSEGTREQARGLSSTAASVDQLSQTIGGLAKGAQEQAEAIGEASRLTAEITQGIGAVAESAQHGVQDSRQAVETARQGSTTIQSSVQAMELIETSTRQVKEKIEEMGRRSDQIGAIVETIEDIASQTNLLALNAAIEAARAGEQGKGFAVVADEVRKLAEKSAAATKEIAELIRGIQSTANQAVHAMEAEMQEVEQGAERAGQAGVALQDILQAVENVIGQVEGIAAAAQQVDGASRGLMQAMDSVSAVVEENTAATEEMAAASNEISATVESIASVSQQNSASVESVSHATAQMNSQVKEVTQASQALNELAVQAQQRMLKFTVAKASGKVTRGVGIISRIDFVKDRYGQGALDRILSRMRPEYQKVMRGKLDQNAEYPSELLEDFADLIRDELAQGSQEILREMTAYRVKWDMIPGSALAPHFRKGDPGFTMHRFDVILQHNWGAGVIVHIKDVAPNHVLIQVDTQKKQARERCSFNIIGWMEGAIIETGGLPTIRKVACQHDGARFCEYDVQWTKTKEPTAVLYDKVFGQRQSAVVRMKG